MTIQTHNVNGLELLVVLSGVRPRAREHEQERILVRAGADLLLRELPEEKALQYKDAVDALDGSDQNYEWMLYMQGDRAAAVAVYDTFMKVPGRNVGFGMGWYLLTEEGKEDIAKSMLELVLQKNEIAVQQHPEIRNLGVFADDVPNCAPLYKASGFVELPFKVYVPSLEDGKEKEIAGEVQLLFNPSQKYQHGIPLVTMQEVAAAYLWQGYASPSTGEPNMRTSIEISNAAKSVPKKRILIPLGNN